MSAMRKPSEGEKPAVWSYVAGSGEHRVVAEELATRGFIVYLRWRAVSPKTGKKNWKWESTGLSLRADETGKLLTASQRARAEKSAKDAADARFALLKTGSAANAPAVAAAPAALTLAQTWALLADPDTGKYPKHTRHRREVKRELDHAVRLLGGATPWNALTMEHLTKLWRRRIHEIRAKATGNRRRDGLRGAEVTIDRLLAIAAWLRGHGKIALTACQAAPNWTEMLAADWQLLTESDRPYEPQRPRHSLDEMRRLIAVASRVDPRFDLLMAFGAELRLAQVRRGRRTDVRMGERTVQVHGRGTKGGTVVECTDGQWAAWERAIGEGGYLEALERAYQAGAIADYRLFPGGQLPGGRVARGGTRRGRGKGPVAYAPGTRKTAGPTAAQATLARHADAAPIGMTQVRKWWRRAETLAEVPQLPGRVTYGVRRAAVDAFDALAAAQDPVANDQALENVGGWSGTQVPKTIYRDPTKPHQRRAGRALRAKIRGETETPTTRTEGEADEA